MVDNLADKTFKEGETVTFSIKSNYEGTTLEADRFFGEVNGNYFDFKKDDTTGYLTASFEMPAANAQVWILDSLNNTESSDDTGFSVSTESVEGARFIGIKKDVKYKNNFSVYILKERNFKLDGVEFKLDDGEWNSIALNAYDQANQVSLNLASQDNRLFTFRINGSDTLKALSLRIKGEIAQTKKITYVNSDQIVNPDSLPAEALPGDLVSVNNITAIAGKYISGVTATGVTNFNYYSGSFSFTMPDADVSITFDVKDLITLSFVKDENIEEAFAVDNVFTTEEPKQVTQVKPGQMFYVLVKAKDGYSVDKLNYAGQDLSSPSQVSYGFYAEKNYLYFSLSVDSTLDSSKDYSKISITSAKTYTVTVDSNLQNGSVNLNGTNTYRAGEQVTFNVSPATDYLVDQVKITTASNKSVEYTTQYGSYTFTMPKENVTISATFKKAQKQTLTLNTDGLTQDLISSASINGQSSHANLSYNSNSDYSQYNKLSDDFWVGEQLSINLVLTDKFASVKLYVTNGETKKEIPLSIDSTYARATYELVAGDSALSIVITAKTSTK